MKTVRVPFIMLLTAALLCGCSSLLPSARQSEALPFADYAKAQAAFASLVPGQSRQTDVQALGIAPEHSANVTELNALDLGRRLGLTVGVDPRLWPPALRDCLTDSAHCYAYEVEQKFIQRRRWGNFWKDFLNFERKVHVEGWQYDAVVVMRGDIVQYVLWSGKPHIAQEEEEKSPLGPLQGLGSSLLRP